MLRLKSFCLNQQNLDDTGAKLRAQTFTWPEIYGLATIFNGSINNFSISIVNIKQTSNVNEFLQLKRKPFE